MKLIMSAIALFCLLCIPMSALAQDSNSTDGLRMAAVKDDAAKADNPKKAAVKSNNNTQRIIIDDEKEAQTPDGDNPEADGDNPEEDLPYRSEKDNFGGFTWTFGGYLGASPYESYTGTNALCSEEGRCVRVADSHDWWFISGGIKTTFSYLMGDQVFIGPRVALSLGSPYFIGLEVGAEASVPLNRNHGFTTSVGVAYSLFSSLMDYLSKTVQIVAEKQETSRLYFSDDSIPKELYGLFFPVQVGYRYVSDRGFIFGLSLEMMLGLRSNRTVYYAIEGDGRFSNKYLTHIGNKDKLGLAVNFFGIAVYLGYSSLYGDSAQ